MNKTVYILIILFISQIRANISNDLQAYFPLGDDDDKSGNSRTLQHSDIRLNPTSNKEDQPNQAYEATSANKQYLQSELSYISSDFTISIWTKYQDKIPHSPDKQPTIMSILFFDELQQITISTQGIFVNFKMYKELNKYLLKFNTWELVSLIRNQNEYYYYTKSRGYIKLNLEESEVQIEDPNILPNMLRLGYTFENQYQQSKYDYYYDGLFSDLRIHSRALSVQELHKIAYTNYFDYQLDKIQIAHYPLNKNLREINQAYPRLYFDDESVWKIQARPTFDRNRYYNSAISIKNDEHLNFPRDILKGLQQFSISLYVFGIEIESQNILGAQTCLLQFYNPYKSIRYFGIYTTHYIVDNKYVPYPFTDKVLNGFWNHIVVGVDYIAKQLKFCVNQQCIVEPIQTVDFGAKNTTIISLAYLQKSKDNNNEFLKLDDLRIFNTVLTDYQIVDVSGMSSAFGETKLEEEIYLFRLDNSLYSELEIDLEGQKQYPIIYSNVEYSLLDFNDKEVIAVHGPQINLPLLYQTQGETQFILSMYVKAKHINRIQSNSKIIRFEVNNQFIDISYKEYNIFGEKYIVKNDYEISEQGWFNLIVKVLPKNELVDINGVQFTSNSIISQIKQFPLTNVTAYGDDFYFTNFVYFNMDKEQFQKIYPNLNYKLDKNSSEQSLLDTPIFDILDSIDSEEPNTIKKDIDICEYSQSILRNSNFNVQFEIIILNGEYYHNYDIYFSHLDIIQECYDFKIFNGHKKITFTLNLDKLNIQFPHLQAADIGCDKPIETNTQCKFYLEVGSFHGVANYKYFTSIVNTPDLKNISNNITYNIYNDFFDINRYFIDKFINTKLSLCIDYTCSEYTNSLDLAKEELAYLEFKILTPQYNLYYPTNSSIKMNNKEIPFENQSDIGTWQEQSRQIYKFTPLLSGQDIILAVEVNITQNSPRQKVLMKDLFLQQQQIIPYKLTGDHMYINVIELQDQGNKNQQENKKENKDNEEEKVIEIQTNKEKSEKKDEYEEYYDGKENQDENQSTIQYLTIVLVILSIFGVFAFLYSYKQKVRKQVMEQQQIMQDITQQNDYFAEKQMQTFSFRISNNNIEK